MNDKERILMVIITRIIPSLAYLCNNYEDKKEYIQTDMLNGINLEKGDLVYANTTIYPNDFCVGFVDSVYDDRVVIKEIGSERLCNYYNESFTKINKEKLGYEILEGIQYKTYQKVLKAFSNVDYYTCFRSIEFDGNKCIVTSRKKFENEISGTVEFKYDSKTTIKSIVGFLEKEFQKNEKTNKTITI